jgi:hypothetical protein
MNDFEYIASLTCYRHFAGNDFERMVEAKREVWFGGDGSGLSRSQFVRSVFFNDDQRTHWEASDRGQRSLAGSPEPSDDLFAPGCWGGPRAQLAKISADRSVEDVLGRRGPLTLNTIKQAVGEALVPEPLRKTIFDLCVGLEGIEVNDDARDQLDRHGVSVARIERDEREELIFDAKTLELLGTRQTLTSLESGYAPEGAIVGWACFIDRQLVTQLPENVPPIPGPPCDPPGSGRGTEIRPGFSLSTGYLRDIRSHANRWLAEEIINESDHSVLLAQQDETDRIIRDRSQSPPQSGGGFE